MRNTHALLLVFCAALLGCDTIANGDGNRFIFLTRPGQGTTGSVEETQRYYDSMPLVPQVEGRLDLWAKSRCINLNDANAAFYYNGSDLGLGREMRCARCSDCEACTLSSDPAVRQKSIACVVSNHGVPQGLDLVANQRARGASIQNTLQALENDLAGILDKQKPILRAASVAMDYVPGRKDGDPVRFYIFDGNIEAAFQKDNLARQPNVLLHSLQLDSEGDKFIRNCLSCHGGQYDADQRIRGASFLDFDISLFCFGDDKKCFGFDGNGSPLLSNAKLTQRKANLDNLRKFNVLVLEVARGTGATGIVNRIVGSYSGGDPASDRSEYVDGYVPKGWNQTTDAALLGTQKISLRTYYEVVAHKYCVTCHLSQTDGHNVTQLDQKALTFEDPQQWFVTNNSKLTPADPQNIAELIRARACGASDMPHAEVTRNNLKLDAPALNLLCNSEALLK